MLPIAVGGEGDLDLGPATNYDVPSIGVVPLTDNYAAARDDKHFHAPADRLRGLRALI